MGAVREMQAEAATRRGAGVRPSAAGQLTGFDPEIGATGDAQRINPQERELKGREPTSGSRPLCQHFTPIDQA